MNRTASAALLALVLVAASHAGAFAQSNYNGRSSQWTAAQKKKVDRLDTAAKSCIARQSLDHPAILEAYRSDNLRPVTDSVWSQCQIEMDYLSREFAYLHGFGTGWKHVDGPYREEVPRAVKGLIKDEIERREADLAAAEENAKVHLTSLYQCTDAQLARLVPSFERAELLTAAAMMNCSREITAAIDAILRTKSPMNEVGARNLKLELRNTMQSVVLTRALEMLAEARRGRTSPPTQAAPRGPETESRQSGSFGTGFVVSEQGHILTNAHVVKACATLKVFTNEASSVVGRVLARDSRNDLALIETTMRPANVPRFRTAVKLGERVSVFGYPFTGILSSSGNFSAGNITAVTGIGDDTSMLQISAPVQPGNSGGPLLDETGNVVGVVVSKLDALKIAAIVKDIPQNINFAIRATTVTTFLQANNISFNAGSPGLARPPEEIADQAKRMSVRLECGDIGLSAPSRPIPTVDERKPVRTIPIR